MNIFNHLIPNDAILGIGPVGTEPYPREMSVEAYGTCRYVFQIHLYAHTTYIYSEWFNPKSNPSDRKRMKEWVDQYKVIRAEIAARMNEDPIFKPIYQEA